MLKLLVLEAQKKLWIESVHMGNRFLEIKTQVSGEAQTQECYRNLLKGYCLEGRNNNVGGADYESTRQNAVGQYANTYS